MMKPLIPLLCYSDSEIFKREQVILFQNLWNCVGFTTDLEKHNDYICQEIGGKSVVIQNFHGQLRAFQNVCSHRFSRIRQQPQGNGPLQCPYHRWVYNSEGIPVGIPHQSEFENLSDTTRECLRLEKWLVETCGKFVFVKLHDDGISLRDYLQDTYYKLKDFSEAIGTRVDTHEIVVKANWKIVVENTLESYHTWSVHEKTFATQGSIEEEFELDYPHSHASNRPKKVDTSNANAAADNVKVDVKSQRMWRKLAPYFASKKLKTDKYHHHFAFPSFTVSTTAGTWFGIHFIHPISPLETKVTIHLFISQLDGNYEKIITDVLGDTTIKWVRTIWEEDKPICELVQLGILETQKEGIFSSEEQRVYQFHKAYTNMMNCEKA